MSLIDKQKEYQHRWYLKNKSVILQNNIEKRKIVRALYLKAKNKPCGDCHETYPPFVMDFDHRPGEIKTIEPARLIAFGSIKRLLEELAKCDLVCSNCHRIRTHSRLTAQTLPKFSQSIAA